MSLSCPSQSNRTERRVVRFAGPVGYVVTDEVGRPHGIGVLYLQPGGNPLAGVVHLDRRVGRVLGVDDLGAHCGPDFPGRHRMKAR